MELVVKTRDGTPVTHDVTKNTVRMVGADGKTVDFVLPGEGSGSGGSGGTSGSTPIITEPEWIDDVCFWDYDGTLIQHFPVEDAAELSELPTPPAHDGLTFLGWNYTLEQVRDTEYPLDIGAMYITADGKTRLHLSVTNKSYLTVPLNWSQTVENGVSIDWGDGTAATTVTGTGVVKTSHKYSAIGEYDVTITVADGCTMTLGGGSSATVFVGGSTTTYKGYLRELYIGRGVAFSAYCLAQASSLELLTIPDTITSIPVSCITQHTRIRTLIIPNSVTALEGSAVQNLGDYKYRYDKLTISIPESVTSMGTGCCKGSFCKRLVLPRSITSIPDNAVCGLYLAVRVFMSDSVTEIGNSNFAWGLPHLQNIVLPKSLKTIGNYFGYQAYALRELTIPDGVTSIGTNFCYGTHLEELVIPGSVTSIGDSFLYDAGGVRRVVFKNTFARPITSSGAISEILYLNNAEPTAVAHGGYYCEIYVADSAFDAYYAKIGSDYKNRVHPLSEYPGELLKYE